MPDRPSAGAARYITPALIALGVIVAAFLIFQLMTPTKAPVEEPATEPGTAQLGPRERYGLTPAEVASLWPGELARRALSKSTLQLVETSAPEDALSASILCAAYFTGEGVTKNDAAAADSCAGAKGQGSTLGAYVLSVLTREGRGVAADVTAADALLREAAATDARAQHDLAVSLRATKPAEARGFADKCAAQGVDDCTFLVAQMQQKGEGGKRDTAAAFAAYQSLSETAFHPAGTRELARMYLTGDGVPRDVTRGVTLLKRAAVLDDPEASYLLARQADKGEGAAKEEALGFYQRAAELGYAPAQDAVTRLSTPPK